MTSTVTDDLALLIALAARRTAELPVDAAIGLAAAIDELTDPLTPPELVVLDDAATRDPGGGLSAAAGRLHAAGISAPDVGTALACARAARELHGALQALQPSPAGRP